MPIESPLLDSGRNGMLKTPMLIRDGMRQRKADSLFTPDLAPLIHLDDFGQLLESRELRMNAEIDLDVRHPDIWGIVEKSIPEAERGVARKHMIELLALYNFGSRLANEVLIRATHPREPGDFGQMYRTARRNPENFDHNDLHERGVDAMQFLTLIMVGTKHLTDETKLLAVAAPMISVFHDSMQLWMEDRLLQNPYNKELQNVNPKSYHVEAAAAYVQILKPIIQKAGHLSDSLADHLVAVLATGISVHDAPEALKQNLLDGDKKPASRYTDTDELFMAYQHGELDRLTLTGAQWLLILRKKIRTVYGQEFQNKHRIHDLQRFIEGVFGVYGFGEQFERYYADQIQQALDDTIPPDWENHSINPREVYLWDLVFTIADTHEMIAPGPQAVVRKERVHWSRERPLAFVETDVSEALNSKSCDHHNQSDWCRQAAEWVIMARLYGESDFYRDPVFAEYVRNTYLRNMIQAQQLFIALARGDEGLRWLGEMKRLRILAIAEKALRKSGVLPAQRQAFMSLLKEHVGNIWDIRQSVNLFLSDDGKDQKYRERFLAQFSRIAALMDAVADNLRHKPGPGRRRGFGVYVYPQEHIAKLEENFSQIWSVVCKTFGIDDRSQQETLLKELSEDRPITSIVHDHPMIPAITPDSLGVLSDARTVNPLEPELLETLCRTDQ